MITYTGKHINSTNLYSSPSPDEVDIATGLGRMCRFGGALWWPVLPHSILTGEICKRELGCNDETWAWCMIHDGHEVVSGETPKGFKTGDMKQAQGILDRKIKSYFGLSRADIDYDLVKRADRLAAACEAIALGLPGYADVCREDNPDFVSPSGYWPDCVKRLADSPWVRPEIITDPTSRPIAKFVAVLGEIRQGKYEEARARLLRDSWSALPFDKVPDTMESGDGSA